MSKLNLKILKAPGSRKFNNETKIVDFKGQKKTPRSLWPEAWKRTFYKAYPRFEQVLLPKPEKLDSNLFRALLDRKSDRSFSNNPIKIQDLSNLLCYSGGMKTILNKDKSSQRMYPSAGARYPLEIYPFIFDVEDVKSGVYHYHLKTNSLELVLKGPIKKETMSQFGQPWMKKSHVIIVISAIFDRTEMKYKDRGYRHILTEYGHVAQNFYLVGTALNLGVCSVGGFVDDGLNKMLDIDGIDESVIGVIAIGNKKGDTI